MNMEIPSEIPFVLEVMVAVISIITIFLMLLLTVKIYKGEARIENKNSKNKGW